jgi:hypothetical protein
MTTHELAKWLLELPDVTLYAKEFSVFHDPNADRIYRTDGVRLCECKKEAWLCLLDEKMFKVETE